MEENKPENKVVYSSQDILSSSAARKGKFFTRIKGGKPKVAPKQSIAKRSSISRTRLSKKAKVIIIFTCIGAVVVAAALILVMAFFQPNKQIGEDNGQLVNDDGEPNVENIIASVEDAKIDSASAADRFNQEVSLLTSIDNDSIELVNALYQQHINEAIANPDISFELTIGYADFLVGTMKDMDFAESILNGIIKEELSPTQKLELTGAYRYLYRESGNQELYDEYNKQLEELNNSASVPAQESGEVPADVTNE